MTPERRADERFKLHSPVEAVGVDASGAQFHERTRVEDVSDAGCCLSLRHSVPPGTFVAIRALGQDGENHPGEEWRLFVVIWVRKKGKRFTAGVRAILQHELMDICSTETPIAKDS